MKNECGKTSPVSDPYEIWENKSAGWEWRVLKKYQNPAKESANPHARWMCAVSSPFTGGSHDLGDVYVKEVTENAVKK